MRYHQNITINGEDIPAEYPNRKNSSFFNEGKWVNFIEPLLPPDPEDRCFIEIGCNVGLFLSLAKKYGFRDVIGVEADPAACEMAEKYRDANGLDYKILNRTVGVDFDWDELPVADVVLLANMHYYIHMADFLPFLDRMFYKTIYCLVVSRDMREKKHGHPLPDIDSLRIMFRDWQMGRIIQTSSQMYKSDPHPRRVHSILFQSRLERQPIEFHARGVATEQQELIDLIRSGEDFDITDTDIYRYWRQRKQIDKKGRKDRWSDEELLSHVQYRFDLVRDIMDNGMKEPIIVRPDRIGIDGGNRGQIVRLLGYNSIIVRIV